MVRARVSKCVRCGVGSVSVRVLVSSSAMNGGGRKGEQRLTSAS